MYCKGVLPCIGIYPDAIPFCSTRFPWGTDGARRKRGMTMKKRLFSILLMCCMVLTLLPVTVHAEGEGNADLGTTKTHCYKCGTITTFKILAYITTPIASKPDPYCHWARAECTKCGKIMEFVPDGDSAYHTGGTETPTCTTGKTCEKCGDEYGILGHDWGAWASNGDDKTHTRTCKRDGCTAFETEDCGGDGTATCVTQGTCTDCGQQYYGGHYFATPYTYGYDENYHWHACRYCEEGREAEGAHYFIPGNIYLKSKATCISKDVYYTNCGTCNYKGTDTYVYEWSKLDPDNHDGGTEIKNAKAATCTEKGYTGDTYCKGCGVKLEDGMETPALDHDWGKWTANDSGTHTRVCKRGATHKETENCVGGTASCTMKAVCEVCKAEYGEKDPEHHAEGCELEWVVTETEHEQKYSLCGKVTVAKEKHTFGDWTIIQKPTSNRDGEKERICQVCQYKEAKTIPATGSSGYSYYTIKAAAGTGGSISPSGNVSVREGRDQTFTITPDKGYAVSDVKIDGKSVGAVGSYTFEKVKKSHTIEVSFAKVNAFVDVPVGSYYEDAVSWAVENSITQGTDSAHFSPDGICTRAQAVTFLWRAAGSPAPKSTEMPFTDVPAGSYYYAVLWAVENGITVGTTETSFSPDTTCSRGQIVTFLWRSEKSPAAGTANPFADVKSTAYYADAVLWAVMKDITKGTTNTTFSPDADCTRAQIVTFLWRCKK